MYLPTILTTDIVTAFPCPSSDKLAATFASSSFFFSASRSIPAFTTAFTTVSSVPLNNYLFCVFDLVVLYLNPFIRCSATISLSISSTLSLGRMLLATFMQETFPCIPAKLALWFMFAYFKPRVFAKSLMFFSLGFSKPAQSTALIAFGKMIAR